MTEIIKPINTHNKLFLDLIVRLLDFDPDSRITVSQALHHPYCQLDIPPPTLNIGALPSDRPRSVDAG